jgi:hypothetical protein
MEAHARAGIDIVGHSLRYAEVEQYGARFRLLRLGSCDFDFDVAEAVLATSADDHVAMVSEALGDVFSGSVADSVHVTVHPPRCYSFFSPLPKELSPARRNVRLQQEAALVAGTEPSLHITPDAVRSQKLEDGSTVEWVHVLAVERAMHERIRNVLGHLSRLRGRLVVGMHAAASTVARLDVPPGAGYSLAIGTYPDHVEYALCRDGAWQFSRYSDAVPPVDVAYFAAHVADRFGLAPREIEALYLYGDDADRSHFPDLEFVFGSKLRPLNPLVILDVDEGGLASDFDVEGYVGCIGAALQQGSD